MCCRCSKELNQWEMLTEYGSAKGNTNSHLVLESAWRQQNYWAIVKDAVSQVQSDSMIFRYLADDIKWSRVLDVHLRTCSLFCHYFFGILASEGWWEVWQPSSSNQEPLMVKPRMEEPTWPSLWNVVLSSFNALTLFVGCQEWYPACKKLDVGMLVVTIWLALCTSYSPVGPCELWGCKKRPTLFPGQMSYKATKPGCVSYILAFVYCVVVHLGPFYVLLVFVGMCSVFGCSG